VGKSNEISVHHVQGKIIKIITLITITMNDDSHGNDDGGVLISKVCDN
jgi:hypothetical protein